jgi:hypothetical protein
MAKPLIFDYAGQRLEFELAKISRDKLYGYKETEALDDAGRRCELATLADDGHTLIGRGGVALGYLTADGEWRDKAQLKPVGPEGNELKPYPSSFNAPIELTERVSTDHYLEHDIRAVYHLSTAAEWGALKEELAAGALFAFPFSYRGSLTPDTAFLLANGAGEAFLAVGKKADLRFVDLKESADLLAEEGEEGEEEADLMDFEMM